MRLFEWADEESRPDLATRALAGMRAGEVWGLNADSAYALCTDAFSPGGLNRIRSLKAQGELITPILIGRDANLDGIVAHIPDEMRALVAAFWPGPLTFLVTPQPSLAWAATREAISVRMPAAESTRQLCHELGPMVAVAAGRSGFSTPTTAAQAAAIWGSDVPNWVDSGPADPELLSTVVDFRGRKPNVVRLGSVSAAQLRAVVPGVTVIAT